MYFGWLSFPKQRISELRQVDECSFNSGNIGKMGNSKNVSINQTRSFKSKTKTWKDFDEYNESWRRIFIKVWL